MTEPPYSWSSPSGDPAQPTPPPAYSQPAYGQPPQGYQYGQPSWLQPGVVPLRPLALGEILDGSIKVIRRYPKPTLGLSAAIALVVTTLNVIAVLVIDQPPLFPDTAEEVDFDTGDAAASLAASIPAALISFVAGLVLTGALITVVGKAVRGQEAPMGEVWQAVRPRLWALLGLAFLGALIAAAPAVLGGLLALGLGATAGGGGLVLGIPLLLAGVCASVYLYVRLSLSTPALVLEKAGVTQSLRRSGVLVKGSWWRIAGILLLTFVIASIVGAIFGFPLGVVAALFFGGLDGSGTGILVSQQLASGIGSVLIAPFSAGVTALLYVDRRMRAEGLDVALRASVDPGTAG